DEDVRIVLSRSAGGRCVDGGDQELLRFVLSDLMSAQSDADVATTERVVETRRGRCLSPLRVSVEDKEQRALDSVVAHARGEQSCCDERIDEVFEMLIGKCGHRSGAARNETEVPDRAGDGDVLSVAFAVEIEV